MQKYIPFLIFICFTQYGFTQQLVEKAKEAYSYYQKKDYKKADESFAYLERKSLNKPFYARYKLFCFYYLGDTSSFYATLKRILDYDPSQYEILSQDKIEGFGSWKDSLDLYYSRICKVKKYEINTDTALILLLNKMHKKEVLYRGKMTEYYHLLQSDSLSKKDFNLKMDSLFALQTPLDIKNQGLLDSLIIVHKGLPDLSRLNRGQFRSVFLIIQHSKGKKRKYYQHLYEKKLKNFLVPIDRYPVIVSRTRDFDKKKTKFGLVPKEELVSLSRMKIEKINRNRVKYGMYLLAKRQK